MLGYLIYEKMYERAPCKCKVNLTCLRFFNIFHGNVDPGNLFPRVTANLKLRLVQIE